MKKGKSKTYYKNQNDKLFSERIRGRGKCEISGVSNCRLECAHIYSRRYICIRWNDNNALCLSSAIHRKAHDQPIWFAVKAQEIKGVPALDGLQDKINNLKALPISFFISENTRLKQDKIKNL